MRWTWLFFLFLSGSCLAGSVPESPIVVHKQPDQQREFQNVYQAIKNPTIANAAISSETVTISTITNLSVTKINGSSYTAIVAGQLPATATNDNASAGNLGEAVRSAQPTPSNTGATGVYADLTSITLTAGDWDISGQLFYHLNGATMTACLIFIGTTAGNSNAGQIGGDNRLDCLPPTSASDNSCVLAGYRASIATSTTFYLKALAVFSAGTPQVSGRISARRAR